MVWQTRIGKSKGVKKNKNTRKRRDGRGNGECE
jgi:hypothetical protein